MSKKLNAGALFITVLLFIVLLFIASMLFSAISKDVELIDFSQPMSEGNVYIQESDAFKTNSFRWYYGSLHTVTVSIPKSEYLLYYEKPRSFSREYGYYVQDDSSVINSLAKELLSIAAINEYSDTQTVSFIASFIQSLKGTPDYYDDYPQFSVETMYSGTGDCEDVAILGSRLLSAAGYDVVLIELDDHVGIGVAINGSGDSFYHENKTYYYTELTGIDYAVGEIPEEYRGVAAQIFNPSYKVLDPSWSITLVTLGNESWYNVSISLANNFTGSAFGFIEYQNFSGNVSVVDLNKERLATILLPVLPSLDHRLIFEFRGVSANTVFLQTAWVTEY